MGAEDDSVLRGFNPIVTSSRVWSHVNGATAARRREDENGDDENDVTVSDLVRGDPFLAPPQPSRRHRSNHLLGASGVSSTISSNGAASGGTAAADFTPEEEDVYARLLRRARDTTGYPYDEAGIGDFSRVGEVSLPPPPANFMADWSGVGELR